MPIRKYIRNKGNGAKGAEDFFLQDKFRARKMWWVFLKRSRKIWWEFLVTKFVHRNLSWAKNLPPPPPEVERKLVRM